MWVISPKSVVSHLHWSQNFWVCSLPPVCATQCCHLASLLFALTVERAFYPVTTWIGIRNFGSTGEWPIFQLQRWCHWFVSVCVCVYAGDDDIAMPQCPHHQDWTRSPRQVVADIILGSLTGVGALELRGGHGSQVSDWTVQAVLFCSWTPPTCSTEIILPPPQPPKHTYTHHKPHTVTGQCSVCSFVPEPLPPIPLK